jgi:hypothetical protein
MRKLNTALLRISLVSGGFFAFLIAIETGLVSARFRGEGILFRWQVWLLAGISAVTLRDLLASLRCRVCEEWKAPAWRGLLGAGEMICEPCRQRNELSGALSGGAREALSLNRSSEGVLL